MGAILRKTAAPLSVVSTIVPRSMVVKINIFTHVPFMVGSTTMMTGRMHEGRARLLLLNEAGVAVRIHFVMM